MSCTDTSEDEDIAVLLSIVHNSETDTRRPRQREKPRPVVSCLPYEAPFFKMVNSEHPGVDCTYRYLFRMKKIYFDRLLKTYNQFYWGVHLRTFEAVERQKDRKMSARMSLAMVLRYFFTSTEGSDAAHNYGLSQSEYSKYIRHGIVCLSRTLDLEPEATYELPSFVQQKLYAHVMYLESGGTMNRIWGAVDGVVLSFEKSGDSYKEGDNYCAYKAKCAKRLCCIFAPDGSICGATWGDGNIGDSTMFYPLVSALELNRRQIGVDMRLLGDSAFANTSVCIQCVESNAEDVGIPIRLLRRYRNYSEIGLGMLMKSHRRLYVRLPADDDAMIDALIDVSLKLTNYRIRIAKEGQLLGMNNQYFFEANNAFQRGVI